MARSNELNGWLDLWSNKIDECKEKEPNKVSWIKNLARYWQRFDFYNNY